MSEEKPTQGEAIEKAWDHLRSTYMVAERQGVETNWEAFKVRTLEAITVIVMALDLVPKMPNMVVTAKSFRMRDEDQYPAVPKPALRTDVREVLEAAHHELTTLHGLIAADGASPAETWVLDTAAIIAKIAAALKSRALAGPDL